MLYRRACFFILPLAVAGCAAPFDYEKATPEQREQYLEAMSQGLYDGIDKGLPRGKNGIYTAMGKRKVYPDRKRIEITVDVRSGGENINSSTSASDKIREAACKEYLATDLARNEITVSVRYEMPGGGTALSLLTSPQNCARFAA